MDPNANLAEQLRLAKRIAEGFDYNGTVDRVAAVRLADLVIALDGWIRAGGFLPAAWSVNR